MYTYIWMYAYSVQEISKYIYTYIYVNICISRLGESEVPTSFSKQIWICTKYLVICTAAFCLYDAPWRRTNSNWIQIYPIKMMTTCRVLYLSDFLERIQFFWEFSPTDICIYVSMCIYIYYIYPHINTYMYMCLYTFTYVCIYIYMCICIYTYTYTYIYTYIYIYVLHV